jgi:UDP-2,4-diacetamido-2,4,6-trideoxy-beta-L-altropyranose hydrolase
MKRTLWIRVDGNAVIGLGHIHRSLALAEMVKDSFEIRFVIHTKSANQMQLLKKNGYEVKIISGEDQLIKMALPEDLVVLDGYEFDHALQSNLKAKGVKIVFIDDETIREFEADVVLNPAGGIDHASYRKKDHTLLFTGPKYVLLRSPFLNPPQRKETQKKTVLVCFGGADPENFSLRASKSLLKRKDLAQVTLVIGASFSFRESLASLEKEFDKKFIVSENLDAAELAKLYTMAEFVVASSSTVSCEAASCTVPLMIIKTAPNQENLYNFLVKEKIALPLQAPEDLDPDKYGEAGSSNDPAEQLRKEQTVQYIQQEKYFDKQSPRRIREIFASINTKLTRRAVKNSDSSLIFSWANDPVTRKNSFHSDEITQEKHDQWFKKKMADTNVSQELFFLEQEPVGMVRIEKVKKEYVVSLNVAPGQRGKGYGTQILRMASVKFFSVHPDEILHAFIKKENDISQKVFSAAGFIFAEELDPGSNNGHPAIRMTYKW